MAISCFSRMDMIQSCNDEEEKQVKAILSRSPFHHGQLSLKMLSQQVTSHKDPKKQADLKKMNLEYTSAPPISNIWKIIVEQNDVMQSWRDEWTTRRSFLVMVLNSLRSTTPGSCYCTVDNLAVTLSKASLPAQTGRRPEACPLLCFFVKYYAKSSTRFLSIIVDFKNKLSILW